MKTPRSLRTTPRMSPTPSTTSPNTPKTSALVAKSQLTPMSSFTLLASSAISLPRLRETTLSSSKQRPSLTNGSSQSRLSITLPSQQISLANTIKHPLTASFLRLRSEPSLICLTSKDLFSISQPLVLLHGLVPLIQMPTHLFLLQSSLLIYKPSLTKVEGNLNTCRLTCLLYCNFEES